MGTKKNNRPQLFLSAICYYFYYLETRVSVVIVFAGLYSTIPNLVSKVKLVRKEGLEPSCPKALDPKDTKRKRKAI